MEVTPDEPIAKLHDGAADPGMSDDPQLGDDYDCQPIVPDIPPPSLWAPVMLHLQLVIGMRESAATDSASLPSCQECCNYLT